MNFMLTQGPITKQLLKLGTPLLIGGLFQQIYGTVDSFVISRWLGQTAFAASGLAAVLINVCIFLLTGCCAGVAILLANIYGSGDWGRFRREFHLAFWLGILFALCVSVGGWFLLKPALLAMHTPPEALGLAITYLRVIIAGLVVTFIYNFLASVLRSVGDTKSALYYLIAANVINTVLDLMFLGILHTDISGAAWATVLSQGIAGALCWCLLAKRYRELIPAAPDRYFDWSLLRPTLYYASVSALQTSVLCVGNVFVQKGVNTLGIEAIAAFVAASQVEGYAKAFAASGAVAIAIFIAQNEGAQHPERSQRCFKQGFIGLALLGASLGVIMYLASQPLLGLFLTASGSQALPLGEQYLHTVALCYALPFIANAFQGWFRGRGRLNIPFIGTALQLAIRAYLVLSFASGRGLVMVAYATIVGWVCLLLFQSLVYGQERRSTKCGPEKGFTYA